MNKEEWVRQRLERQRMEREYYGNDWQTHKDRTSRMWGEEWERAVRAYKEKALRYKPTPNCVYCGGEILESHSILIARNGERCHATCSYVVGLEKEVGSWPPRRGKFTPSRVPDTLREWVEGK